MTFLETELRPNGPDWVDRMANQDRWLEYLDARVGTYEWRTLRFAEVYDELERLDPSRDLIVDVGAGMCDFARYIYSSRNFRGRYLPVDGSIDGVELNDWDPREHLADVDHIVCIETIEHLQEPNAVRLLKWMRFFAEKTVVLTTPNPEVWIPEVGSVANLDPTHFSFFYEKELQDLGYETRTHNLFGKPNDTIIAKYTRPE